MAVEERTELTERERQVLDLVAAGVGTREIAARLGISVSGVKSHLGRIFRKLGVANRAAAMAVTLGAPIGLEAAGLTERQETVLRLAAEGKTAEQIAAELWLSPSAVRFHLRGVYRRLGVRTRYEAVRRLHALRPRSPISSPSS